jgi:signal transduction histidine kinase
MLVKESTLTVEFASESAEENLLAALAHEIRQPLGAIESIAYYLSLVLPEDDKHREQLARVQQLVEQSSWILSNGLAMMDQRPARLEALDVSELIAQAISARPPSLDPPIIFHLAARPLVRLDPGYGRALIENLLALFRQVATKTHPMRLRTGLASDGVEIDFSTKAPGYCSIASLPPGSGLSLDSAQRIAALHGGSLQYSIDPASGIRVRVMLP